jgi:hypothetical protein
MVDVLLLTHAAATLFLVGLIWFVQIVHYPLMARVPVSEFAAYEREHRNRTTFVVAPTMLLEALTAVMLLVVAPPGSGRILAAIGITLLAVIWLSTFLVQVPLHTRLDAGFDAAVHRRLVLSNWLRTLAWTGRGILVLVMLRAV